MEIKIRYNSDWWKDVIIKRIDWNDTQGPVGKSYDLLGDVSIELFNIPGHADGLFAVKVKDVEQIEERGEKDGTGKIPGLFFQ